MKKRMREKDAKKFITNDLHEPRGAVLLTDNFFITFRARFFSFKFSLSSFSIIFLLQKGKKKVIRRRER